MKYRALVVEENAQNSFSRKIKFLETDNLPKNEVLIKVTYSSLNYKDALSARGHKGISRIYPHTPGIDAAGIIVSDSTNKFSAGDIVLVTGYDLGMNTFGGFGEFISVPAAWVIKIPNGLSDAESMMYGTAGFTAAICVREIMRNEIKPDAGDILVTGATGGVGLIAVGILSRLGYTVTASTGKLQKTDMLKSMGATNVIDRSVVYDLTGKPLLPAKWSAVIDTVGGNTLSTATRSTKMHGIICVLGNVESDILNITVYPFLLRGVSIIGIDSASKNMELRETIWNNLANDWKIPNLSNYINEVGLDNLTEEIDKNLQGKQFGRILVNLNK